MYPVTEQYKQQINKGLRNASSVRITFGVTNPNAISASVLTDNGHLYFSNVGILDTGLTVPSTYQTLERNRFVLDGRNPLAPEQNWIYQGYISDVISGEDCVFANPPIITITFSEFLEFPGLTFRFDEVMGEYPSEVELICYNNNVVVENRVFNPNSTSYLYNHHVPVVNKLEIKFLKTNKPRRRARVSTLIYGLVDILETKDIASCEYKTSTDVTSSKLPASEFKFTIFDTEKMYDPENPSGVWEYLEARQPVQFLIGYDLDDGTTEWIPWGNTYSTGEISVSNSGIITEVTVSTQSLLSHLTMEFNESVYNPNGISLYDLAEQVMAFSGFPDITELDQNLRNIITKVPLSSMPVNQCMQIIANAGRCIMSISRTGGNIIKRRETALQDFELDFSRFRENPTTTKYPVLRNLTTEYYKVTVDTDVKNVASDIEISNAQNEEIIITHEAITNNVASGSAGITIHSSEYYCEKTVLTVSGTGTISIKGNRISKAAVKVKRKYSEVGEDLEISNPLISSYEEAVLYADWVASEMARRSEYEVSDRGYPELDVGDNITFTSNFLNQIPVTVMEYTLSFNGTISGKGKYLIGGTT